MFEDYGYYTWDSKKLKRELTKQKRAADAYNERHGILGNRAQKRYEEARSELRKRGENV